MVPGTPPAGTQRCEFGPLVVEFDERVLEPRAWTVAQSEWAADEAERVPNGAILELCSGAGQIGLLAARLSGRPVVQVDIDPVACAFAERNARAAGLASVVEVRNLPLEAALADGETFPLILADPPYLPSSEVATYPADPVRAIDGGDDGLRLWRVCLGVIGDHLVADGVAIAQVAGAAQAEEVARLAAAAGLANREQREIDGRRALLLLERS